MTRATRSKANNAKVQAKEAEPLASKGKIITARTAGKTKALLVEVNEDDDGDDGDNGLPIESVRDPDNSGDSDYQEEDSSDGDEDKISDDGDELQDSDSSDFEPAKKKKKRPAAKPSKKKVAVIQRTVTAPSNDTPSTARKGSGEARHGNIPHSRNNYAAAAVTASQSAALLANEAVAAGAAAAAGAGAGSSRGGEGSEGGGSSSAVVREAGEEEGPEPGAAGKGPAMRYVCEIAKTGRAICRRCDDKITKGALKIGVVTEGSWGPSTQWHHMQCTVFQVKSAEEVTGFDDLDDALQPVLENRVIKSQDEVDDMYQPITPNDLVRKEWTEKARCPDDVMATLLPYQAEGLAWMLNQENLPYKGGILADEMGMGKTLQAICTIVANHPNAKDKMMQKRWTASEQEMGQQGASASSRGGTLVVCPTIALKQWQSELARFVTPGTLKVVIHHGAKRATLAEDLTKADVVLTTYAIVENEHRKAYAGSKVACPDCGRTLYPDKMFVHRKYFCGEGAQRTDAQAKTQRKGPAPWRRKDKGQELKKGKEVDPPSDNGTTNISIKVKGKASKNSKIKSGKSKQQKQSVRTEDGDEGCTTDISKPKRHGKKRPAKAKGKGKGKRKSKNNNGDSDFEGTTDISGRGRKGKGKAKGKRKRAAGDSESDWASDSDGFDSSNSSDDDSDNGGVRAKKEAAFAKVLKDMMDKRDSAEPGVLQEISWHRIMLDEAHFIKDRSTSTAKAVFALTSLYKWCLTGTPLQNRVGELYSLVRFLRLDPHAFYQCRSKGCDCKSLNYRFGPEWRACEECGHTPIMHYANFNRHILNPISRTGYVGEGKKAFLRLKREVLDQILLRRTKSNRSSDICLPPRIVRVRQHRLDEREEDFYQALYTQSQAQFDTYVNSGTILNNYAHIFDILIRLRQAVDHPYLVIYSATKREGMTPAINSPAGQNSTPATPPQPTIDKANGRSSRASPEKAGKAEGGSSKGNASVALGDTSSDSESEYSKNKTGNSGAVGSSRDGGAGKGAGDEFGGSDDDEEDLDLCGICSEPAERPVSSACGHSFCRTCVQELIDAAPGDVECPTCSEPLTVDLSGGSPGAKNEDVGEEGEGEQNDGGHRGHGRRPKGARSKKISCGVARGGRGRGGGLTAKGRIAGMVAALEASIKKAPKEKPKGGFTKRSVTKHSVINRIDLNKFQSSTKMEALMEEVHLMQERDPAAKAIVFSQFVNMLDLIEYRMHKGIVGCRKLSGHLSIDKREEVLQAFQNEPEVKVLLISLKAGGVALNLTVANHIFLMDPWWNPAAEMQAIDRTHRLGQFKPIYATRFIIEDTVEERIIKLQEKKQLVFDSTVGGDAVSTGKLTVDDLRFLFAH